MTVKFGKLRIYADFNLKFKREHEYINKLSFALNE